MAVKVEVKTWWNYVAALALMLLYFWWKTNLWPIVAFVNYRPVFKFQLDRELYKQGGAEVLDSLITKKVITDEVARKKVSVAQNEIDLKISGIKSQLGGEEGYKSLIAAQGLTEQDVEREIRFQIAVEKLVEPSTDEAKVRQDVYGLVQKLKSQAKVWTIFGQK